MQDTAQLQATEVDFSQGIENITQAAIRQDKLQAEIMERVFRIKGKNEEIPDNYPNMEVEEVQRMLSTIPKYAELTTASYSMKIENDKLIITFQTTLGDKG